VASISAYSILATGFIPISDVRVYGSDWVDLGYSLSGKTDSSDPIFKKNLLFDSKKLILFLINPESFFNHRMPF
jgi:hypothetical protein